MISQSIMCSIFERDQGLGLFGGVEELFHHFFSRSIQIAFYLCDHLVCIVAVAAAAQPVTSLTAILPIALTVWGIGDGD